MRAWPIALRVEPSSEVMSEGKPSSLVSVWTSCVSGREQQVCVCVCVSGAGTTSVCVCVCEWAGTTSVCEWAGTTSVCVCVCVCVRYLGGSYHHANSKPCNMKAKIIRKRNVLGYL